MASRLLIPPRSAPKNVIKMWIESATARVRIMFGADELTGSRNVPKCPATPRAVMTVNSINMIVVADAYPDLK